MKIFSLVPLTLAAVVALQAQTNHVLVPTDDTFIWQESDSFTQFEIAQGADGASTKGNLLSFNTNMGSYQAYPLLYWDLSTLVGHTVTGVATLTLHYDAVLNGSSGSARGIDVRLLTEGFASQTTTFSTYSPDLTFGEVVGSFSGPVGLEGENFDAGGELVFTLPASVLQGWIDDSSSNYGVALRAASGSLDVYFSSSEGTVSPTLSFSTTASAIPEPSTYAMIAGLSGLVGAVVVRRRRSVAGLTRG